MEDKTIAVAQEIRLILSSQFGISVADFTETDIVRVQTFVEELKAGEVPLPSSEVEIDVWSNTLREDLEVAGEPLTMVTLVICATIAFCTWRNKHFLRDSIRETGEAVKKILDSKAGADFIKLLRQFSGDVGA